MLADDVTRAAWAAPRCFPNGKPVQPRAHRCGSAVSVGDGARAHVGFGGVPRGRFAGQFRQARRRHLPRPVAGGRGAGMALEGVRVAEGPLDSALRGPPLTSCRSISAASVPPTATLRRIASSVADMARAG